MLAIANRPTYGRLHRSNELILPYLTSAFLLLIINTPFLRHSEKIKAAGCIMKTAILLFSLLFMVGTVFCQDGSRAPNWCIGLDDESPSAGTASCTSPFSGCEYSQFTVSMDGDYTLRIKVTCTNGVCEYCHACVAVYDVTTSQTVCSGYTNTVWCEGSCDRTFEEACTLDYEHTYRLYVCLNNCQGMQGQSCHESCKAIGWLWISGYESDCPEL